MAMEEPVIALNEEEVEHETKEKVLQRYFLQEWELVKSLIDVIVADRRVSDVSAVHKIRSIVDKYQEQGQLLEPFLQSTIFPLMSIVQSRAFELGTDSKSVLEVIKPICIIIYSLVTVCGYKVVIKFFPHQVSDLELAVSLLEMCHAATSSTSLREESTGEMEAKCVILLWLSILVLVPFDISSVDSSIVGDHLLGGAPPPLVLNILKFCKDYLSNAGPMRTISGLVLSRLLTRPDMSKAFSSFIEWAHEVLSYVKEDVMDHHFRLLGAVEALAAIFKVGSKKVLVNVVPLVWGDISALMKSGIASRSPLLRKYLVKLSQRIALTCLPHRSPSWRYVGRNGTLHAIVSQNASIRAQSPENIALDVDSISDINSGFQQEEDMDIPDTIEEMIELLLSGLRDTDTVVRWSAAKGIGRVSSSLTYNFSDEVLSSVLELFSPGEGDGSWHGGCLALAELARRGVLLPVNFPKVVPVVIKALHYDIRRGPHSVGSHVRDAAAYVCWAFGRAYYHRDMRSILEDLAPHLLTVACYDREVNCRRAAAAAFQENVGRQGNYPHGIDIVNTADYFALSSRSNSYLYVAISIAQYDGYLHPFIDELLENKICHWEKGLRELAANALAALVKYDPQYFADSVLEKLIPYTLSSDLCRRHGATLAVGELVFALHQCNHVLSSDQQKHVAGLVPAIEKARLYRGKGGEIMRSAVSRFIDCISSAHIHLPEKVKRSLLDTLNENLRHPNSQIQNAAVEALKTFIPAYYPNAEDKIACDILFKYQEQLKDPNVAARRGSSLAIGVLPYQYLATRWKVLLPKLCTACTIEENPEDRDVESRVNAVKGLISVCGTLAEPPDCSIYHTEEENMALLLFIKNEVIQCLFKALDDYSVDNRGDVGSWVRGAAMDGLERCTYILCKGNSKPTSNENEINQTFTLFDDTLATNLVSSIVKQAVEKMDKIRETAAKVLQRILHSENIFVPYIPYREKLEEIIPNNADIEWTVPTISFPYLIPLLQFSCYSKFVLSGLVISVGGLQESLRKASLTSLLWYLDDSVTRKNANQISREFNLSNDIIWILQEYKRCDRVIIPTLKTIEILMSKKFFLNMEAQTDIFCNGIRESLNVELKGTKDFSKLYSGISILGYISSIPCSTNLEAFSQLLTLLGHRFPKIRKASAEQVYLVLLQNSSIIAEDKTEKALEIISDTCWEGDIEEAKQQRSELKAMAGLEETPTLRPAQVIMSKHNNGKKPIIVDENASYASLVDSTRF